MDKVTRADKRQRISDYIKWPEDFTGGTTDDIDRAILADYAPLSEERRAELEARKQVLCTVLLPGADMVLAPDSLVRLVTAWLREIDAELEGG